MTIQRGESDIVYLDVVNGTGLFRVERLYAPTPLSDNAIHLYVNGSTGNDDLNEGLRSGSPFRTIGAALKNATAYNALNLNRHIVIEVANGTYDEYLEITHFSPRKNIIIRGDVTAMTVAFAGTTTAGDANSITDAGAAFGILQEQVEKILHVWDPANRAATERWISINNHTNTQVFPIGPFTNSSGLAAAAGWSYEILVPGVIITNPGTRPTRSTVTIFGPWTDSSLSDFPNEDKPKVTLAWLQINNSQAAVGSQVGSMSVDVQGGFYNPVGVIYGGTNGGCRVQAGALCRGGVRGAEVADLIFGVTTNWQMRWCAHGSAPTGATRVGLHIEGGAHFDAFVVKCAGGTLVAHGGNLQTQFGANHNSGIVCEKHSRFMITPGGSTVIPFLVKNVPATFFAGIDYVDCSFGVWASPVRIDTSLTAALRVNSNSLCRISNANFTIAAITGPTLDIQNGGKFQTTVALAPGAGGGGEIRADTDATGTFAGLVAASFADAAATNTGARAWRGTIV